MEDIEKKRKKNCKCIINQTSEYTVDVRIYANTRQNKHPTRLGRTWTYGTMQGFEPAQFWVFFSSSKISLGVKLVDVPVALVGEEIVGYLKNAMGMECSRYLNHHQRHSLNLVQLVLTLNSCC